MRTLKILEDFRNPEGRKNVYVAIVLGEWTGVEVHASSHKRAAELFYHHITGLYEVGSTIGGQTRKSIEKDFTAVEIQTASSQNSKFFKYDYWIGTKDHREKFRDYAVKTLPDAYHKIYGGSK